MKTNSQQGFSIVEMMIALVLGLSISGAAITLFAQSKNNYLEDDGLARMQENARYALHLLTHDIAMAGFWGGAMPGLIDNASVSIAANDDCGASGETDWAFDVFQPLQYFKPPSSSDTPNSLFGCISNDEYVPDTNVLAIKHIGGSPVFTLNEDHVYLQTSAVGALLHQAAEGDVTPPNAQDWAYQVHVYHIEDNGDIPTLQRKQLGGNLKMQDEPGGSLVEGIEYFHVQFGIDTTGDGTANHYLPTTPTTTNTAVSVRLYILVRSIKPLYSHVDDKDYVLGDVTLCTDQSSNQPCDITLSGANYYRRVYSTTIQMRNHIYQTQTNSALGL